MSLEVVWWRPTTKVLPMHNKCVTSRKYRQTDFDPTIAATSTTSAILVSKNDESLML
jgi:hypothetical protein